MPSIEPIKALAFLARDFREAASYKFAFVSSFLEVLVSSTVFYFIARLVPGGAVSSLVPYGGDYYGFVIIGVSFSGLVGLFQEALPGIVRGAQTAGTLECLLATPTRMGTILFGSSLYPFLWSSFHIVVQIFFAALIFGLRFGRIVWPGALLVFILTSLCTIGISFWSASFILVYKKGNPFGWLIGMATGVFGGVFFPVAVLPPFLRWISPFLPATHALEGMRRSLLSSSSMAEIMPSVEALALFTIVLVPSGLAVFRLALRKAKRDGTLTHF